jgi:hypothetical protein
LCIVGTLVAMDLESAASVQDGRLDGNLDAESLCGQPTAEVWPALKSERNGGAVCVK